MTHNRTATSDLEHVMAEIESLDLEPIKFKISCKEDGYGWTGEHADRIELAYRRFLVLRAKFPQHQIAPTRDIDAFWHAHILDTRKYAADCERIFGEFMHHYPYLGLLGDEDKLQHAAGTLRQLFVSEFGEDVPNNAGAAGDAAAAWCGGEQATGKAAAWCGVEKPADKSAAWCGVEKAAAWCGVEKPVDKSAAWCGVEVKGNAPQRLPGTVAESARVAGERKRAH